jgi:hypothetical protein
MKKFIIAVLATSTLSFAPVGFVGVANAQAIVKSCSADVAGLAGQGLTGAALDEAVGGLATKIVADSKSGALPVNAASGCLTALANLPVSATVKAALQGIVVALNSGEDIPALAASQA